VSSGFLPSLNRRTWMILIAYAIAQLGAGMILPFMMIYLHNLRSLSMGLAGIIMSSGNITGAILIPLSGHIYDRVGAKLTTISGVLLNALGVLLFIWAHSPIVAVLASVATTGGMSAWWNSLSAMLSDSRFSTSRRTGIFATAYVFQNVGSGIGAFFGGKWISNLNLDAFASIFVVNIVLLVCFATCIWIVASRVTFMSGDGKNKTGRYRRTLFGHLWLDKVIVGLGLVYSLFAIVITALPGSAFSIWAVNDVGISTNVVGTVFTANTVAIIVGQFIVLRLFERYRRTRLATIAALSYAAGCISIYIARYAGTHILVDVEIYGGFILFALGDTLLFPVIPALANDLAPSGRRGSYNSVINAAWQVGSIVGPSLVGLMFQVDLKGIFFAVLVVLTMIVVGYTIVLENWIPEHINRMAQNKA